MTTANRKLPSLNDVTPAISISPKDLKNAWQDGDSTETIRKPLPTQKMLFPW